MTTAKTPDQLDAMVEHIRYEVVQLLNFGTLGNEWPHQFGLRADLAVFTSGCLLEAVLLHSRNLIEFLQRYPKNRDCLRATEYAPKWQMPTDLRIDEQEYTDLSARLVHIGVDRVSVVQEGAYRWNEHITLVAPRLLRAFAAFLSQISNDHRKRFLKPRSELPVIDLEQMIPMILGPA